MQRPKEGQRTEKEVSKDNVCTYAQANQAQGLYACFEKEEGVQAH